MTDSLTGVIEDIDGLTVIDAQDDPPVIDIAYTDRDSWPPLNDDIIDVIESQGFKPDGSVSRMTVEKRKYRRVFLREIGDHDG